MPISLSSWRKPLVERPTSRISVSLCCTKGWSTTKTPSKSAPSKNRAVAYDFQRRRTVGALVPRDPPAGRPGATFEHAGERQTGGIEFQPRAHALGDVVEQSDCKRAPFDNEERIDGVRLVECGRIPRHERVQVDEQAAVAIFGQSAERVDIGDLNAGRLQRLDQRISQPLRELVERHEAVCCVVALQCRMPPSIAKRNAAEQQAQRPNGAEMAQQRVKDGIRTDAAVSLRREIVEEAARACIV